MIERGEPPMKLVKIERGGSNAAGLLEGDAVRIVGDWRDGPADTAPFGWSRLSRKEIEGRAGRETVPLAAVKLAVPIDPLAKIFCVGMNYRDHVGEIKQDVATNPTIFTRSLDTLVPHGAPLIRPKVSEQFDFEGEIAVVIGREARHVREDDALAHVGGYTCFMDGSLRDYQKHSLTAGKNFARSGAMGPWIVSADEFGGDRFGVDPLLRTRLNGVEMQSARASQMIFSIPFAIAYISRWMVLRPGDVIATGTPGGVGSRRVPPLWMKAGDRIEVEVEGVGVLSNPVIDEA